MQTSGTAPTTPKQLSIDDIPLHNNGDASSDSAASPSDHNYFGSAVNTGNYDVEE